jgi:hypothetical protein
VSVDHGGALADHLSGVERHDHVVARFRQIGGQAARMDRLIEDIRSDMVEKGCVFRTNAFELQLHPPPRNPLRPRS